MFVSPPMYRFRVTTPAARAGLAPWRPTRHTATTITDAITTRRRLTLQPMRPPPGGTRPFRPPGSLVRGGRAFPLGGRPGLGRAGTGHHDWRAPQSRAPGGPTAPTVPRGADGKRGTLMQVERIPAVERPRPPERVPLEMILVLVWTGMPAFRSLVALQGQVMILGWETLNGTSAIGYTLLETVVVGACYYGILVRWAWARPLTIGWSLYGFVLSAINPLALLFYQ